jgi:hypothetical protein
LAEISTRFLVHILRHLIRVTAISIVRSHFLCFALVPEATKTKPMSTSLETNMTTTSNWSENIQGAEQMALSEFAAQLEAHVALDNAQQPPKKEDIREEAEILLSLLSAATSQNASVDEGDCHFGTEYQEGEDLIRRAPSFSFTCPVMSLSVDSHQDADKTHESSSDTTTAQSFGSDSIATKSMPAILMGRKLKGDGSKDTDKFGDTVARNIADSFRKAVEWRIQTWIHSLSTTLVQREKSLVEAHASDDIIRELLDTPEARVLLYLQKAASAIEVVSTKTRLNVRPQRINRNQESRRVPPPLKKRKMTELTTLQTESEYKYTVAHVLSFEATLNLKTPAGYTEVTIEAPGFIEGAFLTSDTGEDILTGISVEVDTFVVAKAIERSSRIVARTATHAVIPTNEEESEDEEEDAYEEAQTQELAPSPTLHAQTSPTQDEEAMKAVLVTPHKTASSTLYDVRDGSPLLPDDLDNVANDVIRMVSPQPRSPEFMSFKFTPRTPRRAHKTEAFPSLVSPPPPPSNFVTPPAPSSTKSSSEDEEFPSLSARKSPSLTALLQAMQEAR